MNRKVMLLAISLITCGAYSNALAQSPPPATAPDNSGVNVRDRANDAMTAGEQSGTKGDLDLTARIRQSIVKDDSLSMMAHNVKIISVNGAVTLRGPVYQADGQQPIQACRSNRTGKHLHPDIQILGILHLRHCRPHHLCPRCF